MILTAFNGTRRATGMFGSCILSGSYGLRECADSVGDIVDIGASVGFFSVAARVLCPNSQIVAIEPDKTTFDQLLDNCKHLRIQPCNVGIGTGAPIKLHHKPKSDHGRYGTRYDTTGNGSTEIQSVRLGQLVRTFSLENLFIKIDCEGGERHLLGDKESEEIIRGCVGIGGEYHPLRDGPSRKEFEAWLRSLLGSTHTITFYESFREGICEFRAVRKRRMSASRTQMPKTRRLIRFNQDVRVRRRGIAWKAEQVANVKYQQASHMVCCRYAEYVIMDSK